MSTQTDTPHPNEKLGPLAPTTLRRLKDPHAPRQRMVNHRQLRIGPGSVEPHVELTDLGVHDLIQFPESIIPAFARLTYGRLYPHTQPLRKMTVDQRMVVAELAVRGRETGFPEMWREVDKDGVAKLVCSAGHYAPIVYRIWPDGHLERVDRPYGDGMRAHSARK